MGAPRAPGEWETNKKLHLRHPVIKSVVVFLCCALFLQLINPLPAASAQDIGTPTSETPPMATETATPEPAPTELPTEAPTELPSPTASATLSTGPEVSPTPLPSETPTSVPIQLLLTATPDLLTPAGKVTLRWSVTSLPVPAEDYLLVIQAPAGAIPAEGSPGVFDPDTGTLSLTLDSADGSVHWAIDAIGTVTFTAELFQNGQLLDSNSVSLEPNPGVEIGPGGGTVHGLNGRVQVDFPRGAVSSRVVVYVRGGQTGPFQLNAFDKSTGAEVSHFDQDVIITVAYQEADFQGREDDLLLFYQEPATGDWVSLPSLVHAESNLLLAATNHFTVFNPDTEDGQAPFQATVDSFQHSGFTGAATYSYPISVPPGPGGTTIPLGLSYNSQIVDSASSKTQGSWVGMGWNLSTGYIERVDPENAGWLNNDSFSITTNGVSDMILMGGDGYWHTGGESFWRIQYNGTGDTWTAWDRQGNQYTFGFQAHYKRYKGMYDCHMYTNTWRWMLTKVHFGATGQEIEHSYATESGTYTYVDDCVTPHETKTASYDSSVYPTLIRYKDHNGQYGRYQVSFVRGNSRRDRAGSSQTYYERSTLSRIEIQHDPENDGAFTVIRRYVFSYYNETTTGFPANYIFPNYDWQLQNNPTSNYWDRAITLKSVQEQFLDRSTGNFVSRPAITLKYGDNMHLTRAENGYGGAVEFTYTIWYSKDAPRASEINGADEFGVDSGEPCYNSSGTAGWVGSTGGGNGNVFCHNDRLYAGVEAKDDGRVPFYPGGAYRIKATFYPSTKPGTSDTTPGTWIKFGMSDGDAATPNDWSGSIPLTGSSSNPQNLDQSPVFFVLGVGASNATPRIDSDGAKLIRHEFVHVPTYYRVTTRTLIHDNTSAPNTANWKTWTYQYTNSQGADTAHTNDATVSALAANALGSNPTNLYPFNAPFSEYRGNGVVTEIDPYGRKTVTYYYQDDLKKGMVEHVEVYDGTEKLLSKSYSEYTIGFQESCPGGGGVHFNCTGVIDSPGITEPNPSVDTVPSRRPLTDPVEGWPPAAATDLSVSWIKSSAQVKYACDGASSCAGVRTEYSYDAYGNQTEVLTRDGDLGTSPVYRQDVTQYYPNASANVLSLPARQTTLDGSGAVQSETLYFYDSNTVWNTAPTLGKRMFQRTWMDNLGSGGSARYSQVTFGSDSWGNQTSVTSYTGYGTATSVPTAGSQTASTTFDTLYHVYPLSNTNALNQTTTLTYNYDFGLPASESDPNDSQSNDTTITAQYDVFGRMSKLVYPGDTLTNPSLSSAYVDSYPATVTTSQRVDATNTYTAVRTYDGLGRVTQKNSGSILTDFSFDAYGRVLTQSTPHTSSETVYVTTTTYDVLGRPLTVTAPDGTQTHYSYGLLTTTVTDANNHATTTTTDRFGRTSLVTPPTGPTVSYSYDFFDHLKTATRAGVTTQLDYDFAGRKTSMSDPDMGNWSYGYDALGSLTAQADARNCSLALGYDSLNRLASKTSSGAGCGTQINTSYYYDSGTNGIGRRTSMAAGSVSNSWTYDSRGRTLSATVNAGTAYTTSWTYNSADLPVSMTYPDGEAVTIGYTARKLFNSLSSLQGTYVQSTTYDSAGRMTGRVLGNNVITGSLAYFSWPLTDGGRLSSANYSKPAGALQALAYSYDAVGNVKTITDSLTSELQTFDYDTLDRLISSTVTNGPAPYSETYAYNSTTGNLQIKGSLTLSYNDAAHAHAATSAGGNTYQYDSNGNMKKRAVAGQTLALEYDAENRLVKVCQDTSKNAVCDTGETVIATFLYDGDGARVKSIINGVATTFVGNHYEVSGSTVTKYYMAGTDRVAMRTNSTLNFLLADHLGSTSITTDASGNKIAELRYKAWGEVRHNSGSTPTKYTYTGQYDYAPQFGLQYYNARWYDSYINVNSG